MDDRVGSRSEHVPGRRSAWLTLGFLVGFTIAAYLQRSAVSVAAEPMMPQLGLSQGQISWLETAFLVGYTVFQFPGGVVGEWLGARRMFTLCGGIAVAATLAIPLGPDVLRGKALFVLFAVAQFVLGVAQAPLFAVLTGVLERWFPPRQWALTQGLTTCGVGLGGAAAPALISAIMVRFGWQAALITVALPVVGLLAGWWRYGRDAPAQAGAAPVMARPELRRIGRLLLDCNLIGLSLSYLAMNVVFYLITLWSFLYLVQARHFPVLQGGLSAALPPLGGAIGAGIGGVLAGAARRRLGPGWGLRVVPLAALPISCALLLAGVSAASAGWALAALSLSFLFLETTECCFWAASMEIGGPDAAAAGAILNTFGNIGGIIATPIVGILSGGGNWTAPFVLGAGAVLISAAIWLVIDPAARQDGTGSVRERAL